MPASAYLNGAGDASPTRFEPAWHEPGEKTVLGKRYREDSDALGQVLRDLARHPATANFIATKLARHFVAEEPPPALVARLVQSYLGSEGDLPTLYRGLLDAPEARLTASVANTVRALAQASLGPRLTPGTARQIERAADAPQALALLLSPEFQRR